VQQLQSLKNIRRLNNPTIKNRMLGVMHTYWSSFDSFLRCYKDDDSDTEAINGAINTFKALYE